MYNNWITGKDSNQRPQIRRHGLRAQRRSEAALPTGIYLAASGERSYWSEQRSKVSCPRCQTHVANASKQHNARHQLLCDALPKRKNVSATPAQRLVSGIGVFKRHRHRQGVESGRSIRHRRWIAADDRQSRETQAIQPAGRLARLLAPLPPG
jgi:hypothetical protein